MTEKRKEFCLACCSEDDRVMLKSGIGNIFTFYAMVRFCYKDVKIPQNCKFCVQCAEKLVEAYYLKIDIKKHCAEIDVEDNSLSSESTINSSNIPIIQEYFQSCINDNSVKSTDTSHLSTSLFEISKFCDRLSVSLNSEIVERWRLKQMKRNCADIDDEDNSKSSNNSSNNPIMQECSQSCVNDNSMKLTDTSYLSASLFEVSKSSDRVSVSLNSEIVERWKLKQLYKKLDRKFLQKPVVIVRKYNIEELKALYNNKKYQYEGKSSNVENQTPKQIRLKPPIRPKSRLRKIRFKNVSKLIDNYESKLLMASEKKMKNKKYNTIVNNSNISNQSTPKSNVEKSKIPLIDAIQLGDCRIYSTVII